MAMTKTTQVPGPLRRVLTLVVVTCLFGGAWASRDNVRVWSESAGVNNERTRTSVELLGATSEQLWTPISGKVGGSGVQVGTDHGQVGAASEEAVNPSRQVGVSSSEKVGGTSERTQTDNGQVGETSEEAGNPSRHVGVSSSEKVGGTSEQTKTDHGQVGATSEQAGVTSIQATPEVTASGVIFGALSTCRGRDDAFSCAAREMIGRLQRSGGVQLFDGVGVRWADRPANSSDHLLSVDFRRLARSLRGLGSSSTEGARRWLGGFAPAAVAGKSSFLAGFGLGFLTFALKKLLLPFFIGAQIVKSVLIAMFLPSILGGLGKVVGKGVSTIASSSGSSRPSGGGGAGGDVDDFEFKDNVGFDSEASMSEPASFTYPEPAFSGVTYAAGTLPASSLYTGTNSAIRNPSSAASNKVSYVMSPANTHHYGSYYTRYSSPKQDYKVFHNIPSSSMLLTNYDPFYSPLLSRLDSVYKQLGYDTEACRERLVCSMYSNPARFAPYSNLVSAQLSRELNELRKPSSDNPEILRFFRYMKAAKDGQDGQDCFQLHPGCGSNQTAATSPPLVKTFNDINKLVQARKMTAR